MSETTKNAQAFAYVYRKLEGSVRLPVQVDVSTQDHCKASLAALPREKLRQIFSPFVKAESPLATEEEMEQLITWLYLRIAFG